MLTKTKESLLLKMCSLTIVLVGIIATNNSILFSLGEPKLPSHLGSLDH